MLVYVLCSDQRLQIPWLLKCKLFSLFRLSSLRREENKLNSTRGRRQTNKYICQG